MVRSILVAISPDGYSKHLVPAISVAKIKNADLILLCVASGDESGAAKSLEAARKKAMMYDCELAVQSILRSGIPAQEILNAAREMRPDLIVLGISDNWFSSYEWGGEKAFSRFLLKSVAARVAQEAPCPIWLDSPLTADDDWNAIFCILDLSQPCDDLVRYTVNLANPLGMQPVLFHNVISPKGRYTLGRDREWQRIMIEKAKREIADIQLRCSTSLAAIVEIGDWLSTLQHSMQECRSKLLVMNRESLAWGSNSRIYASVRTCRTSVLVRTAEEWAPLPLSEQWAPFRNNPLLAMFFLCLAMATAWYAIYMGVYLALHTDICQLAHIRCDILTDVVVDQPDYGLP